MMAKAVFVCHSSRDKTAADEVCALLERRGVSCWIAPRDVRPGRKWAVEIVDAIDACPGLLLILSREANESAAVASEVERAFSKGSHLFVLRIQDVQPSRELEFYIRRSQWLDGFPCPPEHHVGQLADAIHGELDIGVTGDQRINSLGSVLVRVPPEYLSQHRQKSAALYVSCMAVSNGDYLAFVRAGGDPPAMHPRHKHMRTWSGKSFFSAVAHHPVVFVRQAAASDFCDWLTAKERKEGLLGAGERYCLPSIQGWRAMAAGAALTDNVVVGRTWEAGHPQPTVPVWSGESSSLGLYHVFGNVFEWCSNTKSIPVRRADLGGRTVPTQCAITVGGGWVSDFRWLQHEVRRKNYGAIWCPDGWPMKDGGFRLWLVSERTGQSEEPGPDDDVRVGREERRAVRRKKA